MFGWCGSAYLGGALADEYGYTKTFLFTIGLQSTGVLIYAQLLGVVGREASGLAGGGGDATAGDATAGAGGDATRGDATAAAAGDDLAQPLLADDGEAGRDS